jgi:transposase
MHDAEFRARMVTESMSPGASVRELARRNGIGPSLIYRWRRLASGQVGRGAQVRLLPVQVAKPPAEKPTTTKPPGLIEIELADGRFPCSPNIQ